MDMYNCSKALFSALLVNPFFVCHSLKVGDEKRMVGLNKGTLATSIDHVLEGTGKDDTKVEWTLADVADDEVLTTEPKQEKNKIYKNSVFMLNYEVVANCHYLALLQFRYITKANLMDKIVVVTKFTLMKAFLIQHMKQNLYIDFVSYWIKKGK